jgi:hypothetical protein
LIARYMRAHPLPFKVLAFLASRSGKITSREDIRPEIWSGGLRVQFELGASNDSLWRKCSGSDENIPKFNAIVCIDIQDLNGGDPTFRLTGKNWSHPAEMTIPLLAARME